MPPPRGRARFQMQLRIEAEVADDGLRETLDQQEQVLRQQAEAFLTVEVEDRLLEALGRVYRGPLAAQLAQAALQVFKDELARNQLRLGTVQGTLIERPAEDVRPQLPPPRDDNIIEG